METHPFPKCVVYWHGKVIHMDEFYEHRAFFEEAMSFYKSAQIVQESDFRVMYDETDLFGPIIYLFRHAAELLFKALIIRKLSETGVSDWQSVKLEANNRKLSSTHSLHELYIAWRGLGVEKGFWRLPWNFKWPKSGKEYVINSQNDGIRYVIPDCCRPIPGDPVVGFKNPDGTITVHKKTCSTAGELASKHGNLIVKLKWDTSAGTAFPVRIMLKGIDRIGLLNEITGYISVAMGVNMRKLNLSTEDGIFEGYIDMLVHDRTVLESMIDNLKNIKGIQDVMRIEI